MAQCRYTSTLSSVFGINQQMAAYNEYYNIF